MSPTCILLKWHPGAYVSVLDCSVLACTWMWLGSVVLGLTQVSLETGAATDAYMLDTVVMVHT